MTSEAKAEGKRRKAEEFSPSSFTPPPSSFETLRRASLTLAPTDAPRLIAEALLAHVLGVTRTRLLSRPDQRLSAETLAQFDSLVTRAAAGEPLAYLTGQREFYGLDFSVDPRVLVPRPETELLVDLALSLPHTAQTPGAERRGHTPTHIIDVGTGSGCIAVTLAVRLPSAHITAVDFSPDALAVARLNAQRHHVADRIAFIQSDLLSSFVTRSGHLSFDLLCANLPYIPSGELKRLPVAQDEPALALDGGPDGLALLCRLLADAPRVMAPRGRLLLEIGATQGETVAALARAAFPEAQVEVHKDLAGLDRVVAALL